MAESRDIYTMPIEETMNPDGGKEEEKEDPIPLNPSSIAADKELSVSETKSRNDDSIQAEHLILNLIERLNYKKEGSLASEPQFVFKKTLLNPKSLVINIPDDIALSDNFPAIELVENEFIDAKRVWVHDLQSVSIWRMLFFYCSIHNSYAIGGKWKSFVSHHEMEAGDVLYFYKKNLVLSSFFYIVPLIKKYGYGLVHLFRKELTDLDVTTESLRLTNLEGDFFCVNDGKEAVEILVSDDQKGQWTMSVECFAVDSYLVGGSWSEFVSAHDLKAADSIRFYKVLDYDQNDRQCKVEDRDWNDRHYLIDYVRAEEAAETSERGGCCGNCFSHSERQSSYAMF